MNFKIKYMSNYISEEDLAKSHIIKNPLLYFDLGVNLVFCVYLLLNVF